MIDYQIDQFSLNIHVFFLYFASSSQKPLPVRDLQCLGGYRHRAQPWGSEESLRCVLSSSLWVLLQSSTEHPKCLGQMRRTDDLPPDITETQRMTRNGHDECRVWNSVWTYLQHVVDDVEFDDGLPPDKVVHHGVIYVAHHGVAQHHNEAFQHITYLGRLEESGASKHQP